MPMPARYPASRCSGCPVVGPSLPLLILCLGLTATACSNPEGRMGSGGTHASLELEVSYPEPLSYLSGIRELSDGSVLGADPLGQVLLKMSLETGTADTLGGHGEGPQEYEGPDRVFPLPGDSSLLVDLGNGRLVVVDPAGEFVDWIPMVRAAPDGRTQTLHPRSVDGAGNLYHAAPTRRGEGPQDSTAILRVDRSMEVERTVAWGWHPEYRRPGPGERRPMLIPMDDWAVGEDGRVAVVRANGFSVDWYLPDGRIVRGSPFEAELFPVGEGEKAAELETMMANAVFTTVVTGAGRTQSYQMRRGIPAGSGPGLDDFEWPTTLPLFRQEGTLVSPDGTAWVSRMTPADRPPLIEVFDQKGEWAGSVELPPRSRLIGFGHTQDGDDAAYLSRTDDLGLVWLERYRIIEGGY